DLRLTAARPPPLLRTLELGQLRVQHRDGRVQPRADPLHELWRQRDLRDQEQDAQSLGERALRGREVDLRLAARDHAVEERYRVGLDDLQRGVLLRGQGDLLADGRRTRRE